MIELANDRWFPIVNLALSTTAALFWYLSSGSIGWPLLVFILVPMILRVVAGLPPFRRSQFDPWLLLFGVTAVIGTFTAYNREIALGKFWVLLGALAIYFAIVMVSRRDIWLLAGVTGPVGASLAIYFVMSNNWRQWPAEIALFNRIGLGWMSIRPSFPFPVLHPNTLGGMMALLLPFVLAFGLYAWQKRQIRWVKLAVVSGGITLGGLIFTSSLGAWLSLAVGISCWFLWLVSGLLHKRLPLSQRSIFVTLMLGLLLVGLFFLRVILGTGAGQADSATRLGLAQQTLYLIEDFALTGSGLATFPALYAQYIQVTPSFFAAYSNLYLDIWLEQGLFAIIAMLVLLGGSFWLLFKRALARPVVATKAGVKQGDDIGTKGKGKKYKKLPPHELMLFRWAAFVSLVVVTLHGLVDDALYGAQASPLLFFAPAMTILVTRQRATFAAPVSARRRRWVTGGVITAVLLLGLFFGFRQNVQAHWYANLGALELARAELVRWPTNQWDSGENLGRFAAAAELLERAIAIDEQNRTAHHRLGSIAMVKRDYETAVAHLEQAQTAAPSHRGIAKALGYSYIWSGQFNHALQTLTPIPEARAELFVYSSWWQRQNRPDLAAKASDMAVIIENESVSNP